QVQEFWGSEFPAVSDELRFRLDEVLKGQFPMSRFVAGVIGHWITSVKLIAVEQPHLNTPRYGFELELAKSAKAELTALRALNFSLIYNSDYVKIPESAGVTILEELFSYYRDVVLGKRTVQADLALPRGVVEEKDVAVKMRHICDWVAGMTDKYALRLHAHIKV
ncbi:MAG: hypothetical protein L3J79_12070, partial [Candidatus Marinimicrobia bacterium]|nr:hypothetical protein [Candidatus Neomarinimicrobiota bacterium]